MYLVHYLKLLKGYRVIAMLFLKVKQDICKKEDCSSLWPFLTRQNLLEISKLSVVLICYPGTYDLCPAKAHPPYANYVVA